MRQSLEMAKMKSEGRFVGNGKSINLVMLSSPE
jgi:hypothetical protein